MIPDVPLPQAFDKDRFHTSYRTAKLVERVEGMTDDEWEIVKRQMNDIHWKLDPEELG